MTADISYSLDKSVAVIGFSRGQRRNAMTHEMFERLAAYCVRADGDDAAKVVLFESADPHAFIAGTDISEFCDVHDGDAGVRYERYAGEVMERVEALSKPTIALVNGHCVGGGMILASACDVRIAASDARFALPMGTTVGNCLSDRHFNLIRDMIGTSRLMSMLVGGIVMSAAEARRCGYVMQICEAEELHELGMETARKMAERAPLTVWAAREMARRARAASATDDTDILNRVYSSDDFREAITAFLDKRRHMWTGR